jgi:hypothetical protein
MAPDDDPVIDELLGAVRRFVDGLDRDHGSEALLAFDEDERRTWSYVPTDRRGVRVASLDRASVRTLFRLLAVILAEPAFARVAAIMALEEVLARSEGYPDDRRHLGDYWLSVFGLPGPGRASAPWGVRFEGHHVSVSVNVTVVGGEMRMTPLFLGANPAVVREGRHVVSAPLRAEEELGFELLAALTVEQRSSAIVADRAPDDILTGNRPRLDGPLDANGVPLDSLDGRARAVADELVGLYLGRFRGPLDRPRSQDLWFAWAGADRPGIGHYYRLAGPHLLVELDNTRHGANHVHTVVRDPEGDFGGDLLAAHYDRHHPN